MFSIFKAKYTVNNFYNMFHWTWDETFRVLRPVKDFPIVLEEYQVDFVITKAQDFDPLRSPIYISYTVSIYR